MSARDDILDEYGQADTAPLGTMAELRGKLDAYRDEVLAEAQGAVVYYLLKKAREYRSPHSRQHALQADAVETMADKIRRGAVRIFLLDGGGAS